MDKILETLFDLHQMTFFSLEGLIAIILIVIPNFLFLKKANPTRPDDIENAGDGPVKLEFWMRFLLNFTLPLIEMPHLQNEFMYVAIGILVVYFILWIKFAAQGYYYPDIYMKKFIGIPVPFDVFNVLYFICVSLWLGNSISLGISILYGVARLLNANKAMQDLNSRE